MGDSKEAIDLAVLAGGRSSERRISLQSGAEVVLHLDRSRFRVWPIRIESDGAWVLPLRPLTAEEQVGPAFETQAGRRARPGAALDFLLDRGVEVVFPVLHGRFGEDGTVQGMCELHEVAVVGSGCAASAIAMDKLRTREVLAHNRIPLADAYVGAPLNRAEQRIEAERVAAKIGFPCFLKLDWSGSSLGVERAESRADVRAFLARYRGLGRRWLAERATSGIEVSVPVLGNAGGALDPLLPIGIYPVGSEYFDHNAKYAPGACEEIAPPPGMSPAVIDQLQELAVACHLALFCDGVSRTDMIVNDDGPVVLEVNTLPGMSQASLLPKAAAAAGLSFRDLLTRLVDSACERPNAVGAAPVEDLP